MADTETVFIKERIQRDGYVLVYWHEVPKSEEYKDSRYLPGVQLTFHALPPSMGFFPLSIWSI